MPRITPIPWRVFDCILLLLGFHFSRQKGSHRVYTKAGLHRPVIIPAHSQDLHQDIIKSNLGTIGLSREEYLSFSSKATRTTFLAS